MNRYWLILPVVLILVFGCEKKNLKHDYPDSKTMGLTLEFHAGDKSQIATAIEKIDLESLDNPDVSKFRVDVSLHITPRDLDLLSESIGEVASIQPKRLGPFLTGLVDETDRGALSVDRAWIGYVAATDMRLVKAIAERWAEKLKTTYPDENVQLSDAMTEAVQSLLEFCKRAMKENCDVVHVWFL